MFIRNDVLVAQPFDLASLQTTGPEVIVARGLAIDPDLGNAQYGVSDNGVLLFQTAFGTETRLALVDRGGNVELLHDDKRMLRFPRMSPDGTQISVSIIDGQTEDVWLFELERRTFDRLTGKSGPTAAYWSPDGTRLAYESPQGGSWAPYVLPADGVGEAKRIDIGATSVYDAITWHADGKTLVFGSSGDIYTVPLDGGEPHALTDTPFLEGMVSLSPDGNWMAFASEEQGREQVYVMPFPGPGRRWVASTDGGNEPVWSRDGTELFYRRGTDVMSVAFDSGADPPFSRPELLFTLTSPVGPWTVPNYDVTADGRFVMLVPDMAETVVPEIVVVTDWLAAMGGRGEGGR
jgi:Tol biopolymer transport system component